MPFIIKHKIIQYFQHLEIWYISANIVIYSLLFDSEELKASKNILKSNYRYIYSHSLLKSNLRIDWIVSVQTLNFDFKYIWSKIQIKYIYVKVRF